MDKQIKKPQILLPTVVQIKISTNKKVTGKILDKQKIDTIFFANCSIGKSFGQTKIGKFFFANYSTRKFFGQTKN